MVSALFLSADTICNIHEYVVLYFIWVFIQFILHNKHLTFIVLLNVLTIFSILITLILVKALKKITLY